MFKIFSPRLLGVALAEHAVEPLPIFDAHVHYRQEAWGRMLPTEATALQRKTRVTRAPVSSVNDDGNQTLCAQAPDFMLRSLRTCRAHG